MSQVANAEGRNRMAQLSGINHAVLGEMKDWRAKKKQPAKPHKKLRTQNETSPRRPVSNGPNSPGITTAESGSEQPRGEC